MNELNYRKYRPHGFLFSHKLSNAPPTLIPCAISISTKLHTKIW